MRFSKIFTLFAIGLLLAGASAPAGAQSKYLTGSQKDRDKKKNDKNPHPPEVLPPTPYSDVRRDNLLNGLQVVTLEHSSDPIVKCDMVIRAGSMFDLVGKSGLAALTQESLLAVNPQLKQELESLQAKIDWGVNLDSTWFHIETPANSLDTVLEILARLLVVENIRPEAFKSAQQQHLEKIKSTSLAPAEKADAAFFTAIYGDHPYGHEANGSETGFSGIKLSDVIDFFKRFYLANNASIVIVGPITQERAMKPFKLLFGGWTKGQTVPATFRQPAQIAQSKLVKVEVSDSPNVELRGGMIGFKSSDPDFLGAEVVARILNARLKPAAESLGGSFNVRSPRHILSGPFYYSATIPADKASAFSLKATETFASLATNPVSEEELAAAKSVLEDEHAARAVRDYLLEIEVFKSPKTYPLTIKESIDKIKIADVQRITQRLFNANAITVVALGRVDENFKSSR